MIDDKKILGKKIKELRKQKGYTQEQLAEKLGIDNKHLSKIEKGDHMPTYKVILKLADALQFNIYEFNGKENDKIDCSSDKTFLKSLKILNSAKSENEKQYYLEALRFAQKGLKLGKAETDL